MTAATATRTRKVSLVKKAPKVRKVAVLNDCACQRLGLDCTRSTKGTWAPGHDARAKGYLQAAHRRQPPRVPDRGREARPPGRGGDPPRRGRDALLQARLDAGSLRRRRRRHGRLGQVVPDPGRSLD